MAGSEAANAIAKPRPADVSGKPNIVLVFIDDMGWADFSCFGNESVQTENFDRLAAEGIRFEQFYVNSPICSPSRVAISTGTYPQRWRITSYLNNRKSNIKRGMAQWLDPAAPMLARFLHEAGYATGHFGKWHMGGQRDVGDAPLITEYGFDASLTNFEGLGPRVLAMKDAYDGREPLPHNLGSHNLGRGTITYQDRSLVTESFTQAAMDFIKRAEADDKPFYVNLWPDDVHSPFFPPESRRGDGSKRQLYHGVLDTADEQIGELFNYIRASEKLRDNTLILVCSDNGPEQGAGSAAQLKGHKTHLYDGGIRSPLVVWGPGLMRDNEPGTVNKTSVFSAIDLVPSLLALSKVGSKGVNFDGESVIDTLLGKSTDSRNAPIFFRRPPDRDRFYGVDDCPDLAMREGDWKLLCEYDGSEPQLHNIVQDPSEELNLASSDPQRVARMTKAVLAWHASMPPDNGADWAK
ncbi:MAG: sulfatase-like hydrolase/transferase [Planctomycetota bacterium]